MPRASVGDNSHLLPNTKIGIAREIARQRSRLLEQECLHPAQGMGDLLCPQTIARSVRLREVAAAERSPHLAPEGPPQINQGRYVHGLTHIA
eukprot:4839415-Heterocapsa_arctica.AAC.1